MTAYAIRTRRTPGHTRATSPPPPSLVERSRATRLGPLTDLVIVGMGYVGLPLAAAATRAGLQVRGLEVDSATAERLNHGFSHVDDISDTELAQMLGTGFRATTDPQVVESADAVIVCVPTPLSDEGGPDLGAVRSAMQTVAQHLRPGTLVVLESTTYPGTTEEVVRPILERSGLQAGVDFALAFSPERIDPGNPHFGMANTPKVVGGLTPACTARAAGTYERFVEVVVPVKGTREAEMAKLLENTYRHVNIALVNEMVRFCHDLDIDLWESIRAASTKPFGFQAFTPGPGVGGHCIPIDPNYLSHNVRSQLGYSFRFVELAQEINASMPGYVLQRVQSMLNDSGLCLRGSRVLLLGVTYKADISDQRESPAIPLAEGLVDAGALVSFHDPHVSQWTAVPETERATDLYSAVAEADLVVLLQRHDSYDIEQIAATASLLLDTRGTVTPRPGCVRL